MKTVYISLLLLLTSCYSSEVDTVFTPYVDKFFIEAEKQGMHLDMGKWSIKFGKPEGALGLTVYSRKVIIINKDDWKILNETRRELLIFHELGHAILNRKHLTGMIPHEPDTTYVNGRNFICTAKPISIMVPSAGGILYGGGHYHNEYDYYMKELFNNK